MSKVSGSSLMVTAGGHACVEAPSGEAWGPSKEEQSLTENSAL
jgi:hypothetical protein